MKLLETKNLCFNFGGLKALDDVKIYVCEKEILGIIGPNGAGKTSLFNLISGIYQPTKGEIIYGNHCISSLRYPCIPRLGIGRTFQVVMPLINLSVLENVLAGYGVRFYSNLKGLFQRVQKKKNVREAEKILGIVGLENQKLTLAKNLTLSLQRRLEIARALALNPTLLLLDESFSGLSQEEIEKLMQVVMKIRDTGKTIILVEHNMDVVMRLCDRLIVFNFGKVIAEGSPSEIVNNKLVIEAYLGGG